MFCWSDGSRMLRSCWMAWDRAMASLVEDGTVPPGVMVVGGTGMFCWSDGSRMLRSCWMAGDRAMASLVEDGTVLPRAVSVAVAWMILCSVSEISGMAQCVG
jgi:hypothetical protein